MGLDFEHIAEHVVPMDSFGLKWPFAGEMLGRLPREHLEQLIPLDSRASAFLWDYVSATGLHRDVPFRKGFFKHIDRAKMLEGNERTVRKWLYLRGLPFDKKVYLSWQPDGAMIVPWKLLVRYFDSFYYGCSDDLTVIDASLNWALLFYHEDEIYFGTNQEFSPSGLFENTDFTW